MYSKNDGYIYFDNKEKATKQQRADGKNAKKLWEILNPFGGWDDMLSESFRFDLDMSHYRRRLASEFRARTDFREDDPVCWCGVNGLVGKIRNDRQYYVEAVFKNQLATFTSSGHHYDWHTKPSLFHGHDVLRAEDQKFPVERVAEPKEKPDNIRKANEVAECTPHWKKNLEHARNGEWNLIDRSAFSCPLCLKYIQKGCNGCAIYADTGKERCKGTPYSLTWIKLRNVQAYEDMVNYLVGLDRRLRGETPTVADIVHKITNDPELKAKVEELAERYCDERLEHVHGKPPDVDYMHK